MANIWIDIGALIRPLDKNQIHNLQGPMQNGVFSSSKVIKDFQDSDSKH